MLAGAILICAGAVAQEINLDRTVRAGELQLFQDFKDPKTYYYLPDKAGLAQRDGLPEFSFLRYVRNTSGSEGGPASAQGEGGGILHALVSLAVPPEVLADARSELARLVPGARIAGPVIYRSGRVALVSSFKQEGGELTTRVLGLGNAPILEGNKTAVSMQLTRMGATLLWDSFQTTTPDLSFAFEMQFAGYRQPYEAVVEADWDAIYSHRAFSAALASTYLGAEIKDVFDDLMKSGAIKVTIKGTDEKLDTLVSSAQAKLLDAMFDRVDQAGTPTLTGPDANSGATLERARTYLAEQRTESRAENAERDRQTDAVQAREAARRATSAPGAQPAVQPASSPADAVASGSEPRRGAGAAVQTRTDPAPEQATTSRPAYQSTPAFSLLMSYEMKKVRNRGHFRFEFNRATLDTLTDVFAENVGDMSRYKTDKKIFSMVNLDDDLYKQREIVVMLDNQNAADFTKYINYVTVQVRKKHQDGQTTTNEIRIDRTNFNQGGGLFRLPPYGWKGDTNRDQWLQYDYKTTWSFVGGKQIEQPLTPSTNAALAAVPPYTRRSLTIAADPAVLNPLGIRLVTINVYHTLDGVEQVQKATLRPGGDSPLAGGVEYIRTPGDDQYSYEVTWRMKDGSTKTSGRKSSSDDTIFADEIPTS